MQAIADFFTLLNQYGSYIGGIIIDPRIIFNLLAILLLLFSFRFYFWKMDIQNKKNIAKKQTQQLIRYAFGHSAIELSIAIVISLLIVIFTLARIDNYAINYVLAPTASLCAAIALDRKIFISKSKEDIAHNEESNQTEEKVNQSTYSEMRHITNEDLNSENYNLILQQSINHLIDNQNMNNVEMQKQSQILQSLRQERIEEKGLELEDLMYKVLVRGYATPAEDKVIRRKYHIYHEILGGNHNIKELYEERYLDLDIHDEEASK